MDSGHPKMPCASLGTVMLLNKVRVNHLERRLLARYIPKGRDPRNASRGAVGPKGCFLRATLPRDGSG